jgi:hypothetical protein
MHALRVEAARAAPNQLERHRIDARQTSEFIRRDPRKPLEKIWRQVVMDIAKGGENDVEIIEKPLGRGGRRLSTSGVVGQGRVDASKRVRMLAQSIEVRAAAAPFAQRHGEQGGEPPRMLLERFNSQELDTAYGGTGTGVTGPLMFWSWRPSQPIRDHG